VNGLRPENPKTSASLASIVPGMGHRTGKTNTYICSLLEIISALFTLASQYFAAAGSGKDHIKIYRYHTFQITQSEAGRTEKHAKSTTQMQDKTKAAIAIM
jgi:hypothetical protein